MEYSLTSNTLSLAMLINNEEKGKENDPKVTSVDQVDFTKMANNVKQE